MTGNRARMGSGMVARGRRLKQRKQGEETWRVTSSREDRGGGDVTLGLSASKRKIDLKSRVKTIFTFYFHPRETKKKKICRI